MSRQGIGKPVEVLLVGGDSRDTKRMVSALTQDGGHSHLHLAKDGLQALAFLGREGPYATVPGPDLILLDLGLSKGGYGLLEKLKGDEQLQRIPRCWF